jgi:hypothetical protein
LAHVSYDTVYDENTLHEKTSIKQYIKFGFMMYENLSGAIRFFTEPPEFQSSATSASIVTSMAEPFSLDNFDSKEDAEMAEDDEEEDDDDEDDEETENMETTENPETTAETSANMRLTRSAAKRVSFNVDTRAGNAVRDKRNAKRQKNPEETISREGQKKLGLVAVKKTMMKKIKKNRKKISKKADELSAVVENLSFE